MRLSLREHDDHADDHDDHDDAEHSDADDHPSQQPSAARQLRTRECIQHPDEIDMRPPWAAARCGLRRTGRGVAAIVRRQALTCPTGAGPRLALTVRMVRGADFPFLARNIAALSAMQ